MSAKGPEWDTQSAQEYNLDAAIGMRNGLLLGCGFWIAVGIVVGFLVWVV
jgi:hypothetical protein